MKNIHYGLVVQAFLPCRTELNTQKIVGNRYEVSARIRNLNTPDLESEMTPRQTVRAQQESPKLRNTRDSPPKKQRQ